MNNEVRLTAFVNEVVEREFEKGNGEKGKIYLLRLGFLGGSGSFLADNGLHLKVKQGAKYNFLGRVYSGRRGVSVVLDDVEEEAE